MKLPISQSGYGYFLIRDLREKRISLLEDNQADADLCVRKQKSTGLQVVVDVARAAQEFVGTGRFPNLRSNSFRSPRFRLEWT